MSLVSIFLFLGADAPGEPTVMFQPIVCAPHDHHGPKPRPGVVCEGVETEGHADLMASFGCDLLQGYHFDKARPIADIAARYGRRPKAVVA